MSSTYRVTIDGSQCDLTAGQLADRAKSLYATASREADTALQSMVKFGALLLEIRPLFGYGSWAAWVKSVGVKRNTAKRATRLAAEYASAQGVLDEGRLEGAIARFNAMCESEEDRIDPASRSLRVALQALGTPGRSNCARVHNLNDDESAPTNKLNGARVRYFETDLGNPENGSFAPRAVQMETDAFDGEGVEGGGDDPDESDEAIAAALAMSFADGEGDAVHGGAMGTGVRADETPVLTSTAARVGGEPVVHTAAPSQRAAVAAYQLVGPGDVPMPPARKRDFVGQSLLTDLVAEFESGVSLVRHLAGRGELSADAMREVLAVIARVTSRELVGAGGGA